MTRPIGVNPLLCGPCVKPRHPEAADLAENSVVVAAARFVAAITPATNALVY